MRLVRTVGRVGQLRPRAEAVLARETQLRIGGGSPLPDGLVAVAGQPRDTRAQPLDRLRVATARGCQQPVRPPGVGGRRRSADATDRPDAGVRRGLRLALERRPRAEAVLDSDNVQRIRQHKALAGTLAERRVRARPCRGLVGADRAQQRFGLPAIVFDPVRPQLVMQFLVHSDLLVVPGVRSSRAGGAGPAQSLLHQTRWDGPLSADRVRPRARQRLSHIASPAPRSVRT